MGLYGLTAEPQFRVIGRLAEALKLLEVKEKEESWCIASHTQAYQGKTNPKAAKATKKRRKANKAARKSRRKNRK